MIVRIPAEGQWQIPDPEFKALDAIDDRMVEAVAQEDTNEFAALLDELLAYVRAHGRPLPAEELRESDVILPAADATLDEVRELLATDGLIPG